MTFVELQNNLNQMRYKRTVLSKLVEIMDSEFMPDADGKPKMVLLTEEKVKVPEASFDEVANDLNAWIKTIQAEELKLLNSKVDLTPPSEPPKEDKAA